MSIRPLIIGPEERTRIADLKALAAGNIQELPWVQAAVERDVTAFRDMMALLSIDLPTGYVVTYTHERQPDPRLGVVQHISISVPTPNKFPGIEAIEMILKEFGMRPLRHSLRMWPEQIKPGHGAVNIVQRL